jgi:hypothetical protein
MALAKAASRDAERNNQIKDLLTHCCTMGMGTHVGQDGLPAIVVSDFTARFVPSVAHRTLVRGYLKGGGRGRRTL